MDSASGSSFGTVIHGSPLGVVTFIPLALPSASEAENRFRPAVMRFFRSAMNARVQRLAGRGVVHGASGLEVAGQVVLRVAPASGTLDMDLAAADRVPQGDQGAQLERDALDLALVSTTATRQSLRTTPSMGTPSPAS
ncbi:hypothetical protein ACFCYI_12985 [Streptomyces sp. NPDC056257]|uniref:hypothetical protein n=1 Tax=Streptomyces sp. NPDC056257 TaxID=3345765 RepID=UPI0035E2FCA6